MILMAIVVFVVSSAYFYVKAFKLGLNAKKWAVAGLVFGPFIFPMFSISAHIAWRRDVGFDNLYIGA